MLRFLFVGDGFAIEPVAADKVLTPAALPVLQAAIAVLPPAESFTAAAVAEALKGALVEDLGLKPKAAFTPVRVAVTGRTVSPPLYESMELLGHESTLVRLRAALDRVASAV